MCKSLMYIAVAISATIVAGCGYRHGDFALDGRLQIELSPAKGPCFNGIFIKEREGGLFVSGFGSRPARVGNIEVKLIAPDGAVLATERAPLLAPRPAPKRSYNYRFEVLISFPSTDSATLRISFVPLARAISYADPGTGFG